MRSILRGHLSLAMAMAALLIGSGLFLLKGNPVRAGHVPGRTNTGRSHTIGARGVRQPASTQPHRPAIYIGDDGVHGFTITTPASLQNGAMHSIHVKFEASATELSQSPASITCTTVAPNYVGFVDHVGCDSISGWAADRERLNTPITVSVYANGVLVGTMQANASRPDVGTFLGDNGIHGFTFTIPASMKGGATTAVVVRFEGSATSLINNSLTSITCP